jgi:hypothetical protein
VGKHRGFSQQFLAMAAGDKMKITGFIEFMASGRAAGDALEE